MNHIRVSILLTVQLSTWANPTLQHLLSLDLLPFVIQFIQVILMFIYLAVMFGESNGIVEGVSSRSGHWEST